MNNNKWSIFYERANRYGLSNDDAARALAAMKSFDQGLETFGLMSALDPDKASKGQARVMVMEAADLSRQGRMQEAIWLYENATRLDPDSEIAIEGLLLALLAEANQFMDQGRSEEALKVDDRALILDPEDVGAQEGKRKALLSQGSKEEVSQGINETGVGAGLVSQKDIDYYNNLNRSFDLLRNGSISEALASLNRAIEIDENSLAAWMGKGQVLLQMGRYQEALDSFDRAVNIDSKNKSAWASRILAPL